MKILYVSAEVAPFSKVGGLGDVAGALPKALAALGADVRVITPKYASIDDGPAGRTLRHDGVAFAVAVGRRRYRATLWQSTIPNSTVPVYFLRNRRLFDRPGIYLDTTTGKAYPDEPMRFAFLSRGALRAAEAIGFTPDVIHLNDHHTAPVIGYLTYRGNQHPVLRSAKTVFTIHNLGYQGIYSHAMSRDLGMPRMAAAPLGPLEFFGNVSFMKLGIALADAVTTVSPSYADEIQGSPEFGMGLEGILSSRSGAVRGILNGIDYTVWNPQTDPHLAAPYSDNNLSGKGANRAGLLRLFGWPEDSREPIVAMIGRLAAQKGWDLVLAAGRRMVKLGVRLAVLGTGDTAYERGLLELAERHPSRVGATLRFDEARAHLMEAGADMFLMPSRYEPCGLNQMISLRYGTVPVVRATGGLRDTVAEFDPGTGRGNGFLFEDYTPDAMLEALARALRVFRQRDQWRQIVRNGMSADHSWTTSARAYLQLYDSIVR